MENFNLFSQLRFSNCFHQLDKYFFSYQQPEPVNQPGLIHINPLMTNQFGFDVKKLCSNEFYQMTSANKLWEDNKSLASNYSGRRFGEFIYPLEYGQEILFGEVKTAGNQLWELQLKSTAKTFYKDSNGGRYAFHNTIREYLCSEALAAQNIPTTRSLAMIFSEEDSYLKQINNAPVMLQLSPSFIHFGHFKFLASKQQYQQLKELTDFVIKHFYPQSLDNDTDNIYLSFFYQVLERTAKLVAKWQSVGFYYGALNSEQMSILGLTLVNGEHAFLEKYNRQFRCNHSEDQHQYSFINQPSMALWNLQCLAQSLSSFFSEKDAKEVLDKYEHIFQQEFYSLMFEKLGIDYKKDCKNTNLISDLLSLMDADKVDYNNFFRKLSSYAVYSKESNSYQQLQSMFIQTEKFDLWSDQYDQIIIKQKKSCKYRKNHLNATNPNPKHILRNDIAQEAIKSVEHALVEKTEFKQFNSLVELLTQPYSEHPVMEESI